MTTWRIGTPTGIVNITAVGFSNDDGILRFTIENTVIALFKDWHWWFDVSTQ